MSRETLLYITACLRTVPHMALLFILQILVNFDYFKHLVIPKLKEIGVPASALDKRFCTVRNFKKH